MSNCTVITMSVTARDDFSRSRGMNISNATPTTGSHNTTLRSVGSIINSWGLQGDREGIHLVRQSGGRFRLKWGAVRASATVRTPAPRLTWWAHSTHPYTTLTVGPPTNHSPTVTDLPSGIQVHPFPTVP